MAIRPLNSTWKGIVWRAEWRAWLGLCGVLALGVGSGYAYTDFVPTDDTYVDQAAVNSNFGTTTRLLVRSGASAREQNAYLKFNVSGLPGSVVSAKIEISSVDVSGNVTIHPVSNTSWSETLMTWNNRPATGSALATVNCVAGNICEFDVTSAVSSNGVYAFCLKGYAQDVSDSFKSKEGNVKPVLRIETSVWRIIDPGFPTDDVVVVPVVMNASLLPANPTSEDCSAAFNTAIQDVAAMGGGYVYVPAGQYLLTNSIDFQRNVILRGAWGSVAGTNKTVRGTVLKVTYNGSRAFIRLQDRAGLQDLTIWYPNQSLTNVIPYSATIDGAYAADGITPVSTEEVYIKNVNLLNSYIGLAPQCNMIRARVSGLYGSPLSLAVYQKASSDVPFYSDLNFSADYWALSGLPGAPAKTNLQTYLRTTNSVGIKVASSDNIFGGEWHVADYNQGFYFLDDAGTINGNLYGLTSTNCVIGLNAVSVGITFFINCAFQGDASAVILTNMQSSGVVFNGCTFSSGSDYDINCLWNGNLSKGLRFQHCAFSKKILAGSTDLSVVDSTFSHNGPTIRLANKTGSAIIAGNTFAYTNNPIELNGASSNIVAYDSNPTFSKTYTPFDIHGYNQTRKPAATNLIVMGTPGHAVAVNGTTDDAPAIQTALNAIASLGGGIVFLPQISVNGYAIRTPLNVPAGVELSSSAVGKHSFNAGEEMAGALLQIYHGRTNATPAITLNAGSGLKGLTVHYPEELVTSITPYSFAVRATGAGAYVQNMQFLNAYNQIEFNGSDNHLAENILGTHLHNTIKAVNCANGRLQDINTRDEWDDSGLPSFNGPVALLMGYSMSNAIPYDIQNCSNMEVFGTFSRMSKWVGSFSNSTLHTLDFSSESCNNIFQIRGIPDGGSVELIGSSVRANNDTRTTLTMLDVANTPGDGDLRVFSALMTGYPDTILRAADADCTLQQCVIDPSDMKVATHGITLAGSNPGVVRVENCRVDLSFVATDIADTNNKRLELVGNLFFDGGLEYFTYQSRMQETVNPASLSISTRLAEVANFVQPAISAQMNLATPGSSGLTLLTTEYTLETRDQAFKQWYSTITGYAPTNSPKELLFQVTSALFTTNTEPSGASLQFFYYDWQAGRIDVSYKLPGSTNWIIAGVTILTGDGGYVLPQVKDTNSPYWLAGTMAVPGTLFKQGTQIKLTVTGAAIFSYLNLESTGATLQPPFGGVINQAPAFAADPFTKPNAAENAAYSGSISGDASDADAGDTLTFSKVSGPAWLAVSTDGTLSGTPLQGDVGTNAFVIRATDPGGMYDEASMNITVISTTPPRLDSVRTGMNLTLSWPADHIGWVLESNTNLLSANWVEVAGTRTNASVVIPISPVEPAVFYRLRYP